jgi:acetyl-CoA synthetase
MSQQIENVLHENRHFPPPRDFQQRARISTEEAYQRMFRESIDEPERFWGRIAQELPWLRPFDKVLDWSNAPFAKWFTGGRINASSVCLDQHILGRRADQRAIVWEGEPGETRTLTYSELHLEVCRFANVLKSAGSRRATASRSTCR